MLWPELTARQHLQLYANFKGVVGGAIKAHCDQILGAVSLLGDADNLVTHCPTTYSLGQVRGGWLNSVRVV